MEGRIRFRGWRTFVAAASAVAAFGATGATGRADDPPACPSSTEAAYALELRALTGPQGADLTLGVTPSPGCAAVDELKKVQLKTFDADGSATVKNVTDVAAPGGVA